MSKHFNNNKIKIQYTKGSEGNIQDTHYKKASYSKHNSRNRKVSKINSKRKNRKIYL